jgi:xanthine/uracil permease
MTTQTFSVTARIRIATDLLFIVAFAFSFITGITYVFEYPGASPEEVIGTLSVTSVLEFLQQRVMGLTRWPTLLALSVSGAVLMLLALDRLDPD